MEAAGSAQKAGGKRRAGWVAKVGVWVGIGAGVVVVCATLGLLVAEREERVVRMLVYPAAVAEEAGGWIVLRREQRPHPGVPIRVELCETVAEVGIAGLRRGVRTLWVDEVTSTVSLRMVGREYPGWIVEDPMEEEPLVRWVGRAPVTWTEEAKERALDYFAEERPDLVRRIRSGQRVRVLERAGLSSATVRGAGAMASAGMLAVWVIRAGRGRAAARSSGPSG